MDLNEKQIQIIVNLKNNRNWMSSEEIANSITTNKKTVQLEVKSIISNYKNDVIIEINSKKGYKLVWISRNCSDFIAKELKEKKIYSSMGERASVLLVFLLFQKHYISMQNLGDIFFLSKSSISIEIKTIQRWLSRRPNVKLDISSQKGIKVIAKEEAIRVFLSIICKENILKRSNIDSNIIDSFVKLNPKIEGILKDIIIEKNFIISGEDYYRFVRYLNIIIVREKFGFESNIISFQKNKPDDFSKKIIVELKNKLGIKLSDINSYQLTKHIIELNKIESVVENFDYLYFNIKQFEFEVAKLLKVEKGKIKFDNKLMANHLNTMINRINSGNNILNHFASQILLEFPLEAYIVKTIFPKVFKLFPNLAESSYLVLYVAEALRNLKYDVNVLLLTNQSTSMIGSIATIINEILNFNVGEFHFKPLYLFENDNSSLKGYDLLLTTEQELLFVNDHFIYLPILMSQIEVNESTKIIKRVLEKQNRELKNELKNRYISNINRKEYSGKDLTLDQIIPDWKKCIYFPISNGKLFICGIGVSDETLIEKYYFKFPIRIDNFYIKNIIYVTYSGESRNMFTFFEIVSDILKNE